jgi:hypothetical protein
LARLDLFSGLIALYDAANLCCPCSGEFAVKERAEYEENNSQATDREHTGKEPERMKNCCGLHYFFAQPVFFPYPVYASLPYDQVAEQTPAAMSDQQTDLAGEVDRLRDEVERLREERRAREEAQQARPPSQPSAEDKTATTILVFRDGRRSEIQNYAIVGQTLWVFTEQRARKLPMSDLDVEATRKFNADRGVDFRFP